MCCTRPSGVKSLALAALLAIPLGAELSPGEAASLRGGAATENITADAPSRPVHDPLMAKALVLDDGRTQVVIVALDLVQASPPLVAGIRRRLREELGIAEANVLVAASHNHHTGGQVATDVVERTVGAVRRAAENAVPVRVGAASGQEDRITMNRRLRLVDGSDWTIRRANPSPPDDEVASLGPVDPEIGVLRVDTASGRTLAVVYNFAGHPYGGVPGGAVTADFPAFASAVIEEATGGVALFLQGAAGDVTPIRYKDFDAPPPTEQLGTMLGLSTLKAVNDVALENEAELRVASESVELPRRADTEALIRALEAEQETILDFFTGIGCGTHGAGTALNFKSFLPLYLKHRIDPEHPAYASYLYQHEAMTGQSGFKDLDAENEVRLGKYLECIESMEKLIRIRSNLQILKARLAKTAEGPILAEVQGVRIGDCVLVTFPGELFAEVALRIKEQSPFANTFVAGCSNGAIGYAPTADAYRRRAYEDLLAQLAPEWQKLYESKVGEILHGLSR